MTMVRTVGRLLAESRALLAPRLSPGATARRMAAGCLVIDIRGDEQQRRDGLIPGALVIRRNVLEWRCDPASRWRHPGITSHDAAIILVCNEGYQSSLAAANLQRMGMRRATDMVGGFVGWKRAGLPVVPYDERLVGDAVIPPASPSPAPRRGRSARTSSPSPSGR
jgi:rhodanese-related sulfurtransferase